MRAENKAPKTIAVYLDGVGQLIDWLDQLPSAAPDDLTCPADPAHITKRYLVGWMGHLLSIRKPATANNRYRAVQQWFNWLLIEGEIDAHPMATMKPPFVPEQQVPLVPMDLIRKILADCAGRDLISRRDTALIRLIWDTGCRLNEIADLKVDDVDLDLDVIHVVGKGGVHALCRLAPRPARLWRVTSVREGPTDGRTASGCGWPRRARVR
jgi:site-specific recombinase XerC